MSVRYARRAAIVAVVAWISAVTPLHADERRGDPKRGFELSEGCASCHEADGRSFGYRLYPRIAGQHYVYLLNALREFRNKERHQAYAVQMWDSVTNLSDQDLRDLAAFYSSLPW